jgi:RND family efflux transporter MFP subunit
VKEAGLAALLLLLPGGARAAGPASAAGEYSSHLMVDQEVHVTARMTGIIERIHVDRGSVVTRNQPLASLDARELDLNIRESKEEVDLRKAELDRAEALSAGKVVSRAELDERRARHEMAQARWEKARELRDRAVIRAPFAGVVSERWARVGQKVIIDEDTPLFKITALEPLLARVYLPEEQLLRIRKGDAVEVVPLRFPRARTTGAVQFISPTIDPASGTFQVIVRVRREKARELLRPGLAVKIRFGPPPPG